MDPSRGNNASRSATITNLLRGFFYTDAAGLGPTKSQLVNIPQGLTARVFKLIAPRGPGASRVIIPQDPIALPAPAVIPYRNFGAARPRRREID
jgi:hypothetical protein